MSETTPVLKALKDELLKQNGTAAVGDEMDRLRRIVESQRRRARRLTAWTIGVWAAWFALVTLGVGIPFFQKVTAPQRPIDQPTTQATATTGATRTAAPRAGPVGAVVGILFFGFLFAAPFVGVVLAVMMILARRTAGMSEIRASLASIDAQRRLLARSPQHLAPPPPPAATTGKV
jgi:hypothetical protein